MSDGEVTLFECEGEKTRADVCAFLHELADEIADGRVTLDYGNKEIVLRLPEDVLLEVEVEEETADEGTQRSLEIEIEWLERASEE